jgi:hypothetical protein
MNPSWSAKKPSLASEVLETPTLWGFAENMVNRYSGFSIRKPEFAVSECRSSGFIDTLGAGRIEQTTHLKARDPVSCAD